MEPRFEHPQDTANRMKAEAQKVRDKAAKLPKDASILKKLGTKADVGVANLAERLSQKEADAHKARTGVDRFQQDPNFPRNTHFKPPTPKEFDEHVAETEEAHKVDKDLDKKIESGNIIQKLQAKARKFWREQLEMNSGADMDRWTGDFKERAHEDAQIMEQQHEYFQRRVKAALKDLRDFEVEKLGMKPKNREVVEVISE